MKAVIMARSENCLRRDFWFGNTDPRPLALFRIALGAAALHDLANYAVDLPAFLTDEGMLPRGVQLEPRALSFFDSLGSTGPVAVAFALGVLAVFAFTIGFQTRLATVLSWLFLTSLHTRNLYVTDGGDDLLRNLMFLSIFVDLGACFSVDAHMAKSPPRAVSVVGLRFLQLHLALLYFCAGRLKLRAGWLTHNVVYQCLQLTGFVRPLGHWMLTVPGLCMALGVLTVVLELAFAFFAFSPFRVSVSRALAIGAGVGVQIGILLTMRVGVFTETTIAAMVLFALPAWFEAVEKRVAWLRLGSNAQPNHAVSPGVPLVRKAIFALLAAHFIALAWGPFIGKRVPPPAWLVAERKWLWLEQPFGLFDVVYDIPRWEVTGMLEGGTLVDVLPIAVPALVPAVGWSFSRWYKFTFKERERPYPFDALAAFFCSAYREKTGTPLLDVTIFENLTPPRAPGEIALAPTRRERFHAPCP